MPSLGLIILAAGGSTRMRKPKQFLRWGDETLLRLACKTALKTTCRPVLVVLGCGAEACRNEVVDLSIKTVVNPNWQKGMGSSVSTGIAELEAIAPEIAGALIMLVDQPTVTEKLLDSLVTAWNPPHAVISAISYDGVGGVPAVFDRSLFGELKALEPDRGARPLIVRESARTRLVRTLHPVIDLDTEEAYLRESTIFTGGQEEPGMGH